jgi:hypothetical protein
MEKLSLKKIGIAIAGLYTLMHLQQIKDAIAPVFEWFGDALHGFYDFPPGAQAAIAVFTIILAIVFVTRKIRT